MRVYRLVEFFVSLGADMHLKDVPYPLRLCVEMLHCCGLSNEKTQNMKSSEIKNNLRIFFTDEQIEEAKKILIGDS